MQIMGHLIKPWILILSFIDEKHQEASLFSQLIGPIYIGAPFTIFVLNLKKHANTIIEIGIDFLSVVLDYLQVLTFWWLIAL